MADECAEVRRLEDEAARRANWKRWGPYLSDRQWGTVREDYSVDGSCWTYFSHEDARLRAYRWGEDGLLGICDRRCRLCFGVALWNGNDPILKERLFGLTNPQGNHGEDVKELYYHLDATPTSSYLKSLYKYPHARFPYERLVEENARRGTGDREFEIEETGVFDEDRYFDVQAEYAKASPNDICIRLTLTNRGPEPAALHVLPTLWFRNGWAWGAMHDGCFPKPDMRAIDGSTVEAVHEAATYALGAMRWHVEGAERLLFTDNESNSYALWGCEGPHHCKDAFHRYVCDGDHEAVNSKQIGTKAAALFRMKLAPGESRTLRLRLTQADEASGEPFADHDAVFERRITEADAFYESIAPPCLADIERPVWRQAYAGLLWTKQFYHYVVDQWIEGDPATPPPPPEREDRIRNDRWRHLFNYDIVSMPDKWEYPWYAAWDLAFHMLPMARIDPDFAKKQLKLLLREWYMRADGAIPAYEFHFGDVNPPVHAWAVWRVYKMTGPRGGRDRDFLASCFHKLLLNFTWWVNQKDSDRHIFGGGFLGMDNVGVFDRSHPPVDGQRLEQADGTAWMAFYCVTMLAIALELAEQDASYEGIASKFFEHFAAITHAMNTLGGTGLWDERDGFYYDQLFNTIDKSTRPLRIRSLVGLVTLCANGVIEADTIDKLPGFKKRMNWFLKNQKDLARSVTRSDDGHYLLSVAPRDRLDRILGYLFDPREFLGDFGVRSLSKYHDDRPFFLDVDRDGQRERQEEVRYVPGESMTHLFGGNSNWRGPIWFPLNFLLVEALQRYDHFWGDGVTIDLGDGPVRLNAASDELQRRLVSIFLPDADGRRPVFRDMPFADRYASDPHFRELLQFYEYFHGDTGRGCGASHQTGWTALVTQCIETLCRAREAHPETESGRVHGVRLGS